MPKIQTARFAWTTSRLAMLEGMIAEGMTAEAMAKRFGCHVDTVRKKRQEVMDVDYVEDIPKTAGAPIDPQWFNPDYWDWVRTCARADG